jgi:hypothetical protein
MYVVEGHESSGTDLQISAERFCMIFLSRPDLLETLKLVVLDAQPDVALCGEIEHGPAEQCARRARTIIEVHSLGRTQHLRAYHGVSSSEQLLPSGHLIPCHARIWVLATVGVPRIQGPAGCDASPAS